MISVIIPIYKAEQFLVQCLDSVSAQTFKDLDIILMDDGSPDRSGEICDSYAAKDSRIRVFHTENQGHYLTRNFALEKAREIGSKYIGFVDADDWIEPDMYEKLFSVAEEHQADVTLCGYYVEKQNKHYAMIPAETVNNRLETMCAYFSSGFFDMFWNKLYRIECFDGIRFPANRSFQDALVNYSIYTGIKRSVCLSSPLYHYRQVAKSIIHVMDANLINRWILNRNKYNYCVAELKGKVDEKVFEKAMKHQTRNCAIAIAENWKWWKTYSIQQQRENARHLADMNTFSKMFLPLFGFAEYPIYLKVYSFLSHYNTPLSLCLGSIINKFLIWFRKRKNEHLY